MCLEAGLLLRLSQNKIPNNDQQFSFFTIKKSHFLKYNSFIVIIIIFVLPNLNRYNDVSCIDILSYVSQGIRYMSKRCGLNEI